MGLIGLLTQSTLYGKLKIERCNIHKGKAFDFGNRDGYQSPEAVVVKTPVLFEE